MTRIAFLGLGQMGAPMALRVVRAGFDLTVYDPSARATAPLTAEGATAAASIAEAASGRDVVIACLPNQAVSRAVGLEAGGVRDAADFGVYVEMSTIGSAVVEEIAAAMAARGAGFLDAPVSGGPRGANAGTLTTMVAGSDADFATCEPVLNAIAGNVFRVGSRPGQGQVAKLCNNMISATAMAVSFEAVTMGVKAGIDADTLVGLINVSTGRTGATLDKFPQSILPRTFDYGGKLATMYKDVMLCLEEYRERGVPHHVSSSAAQIWFQGMAEGRGDDDYTSLIKVVEKWAGVEVVGKAARRDA
ncbi:NAD(P)-dependent oxidoreductase [Aquibium sp. ELW1220]|uniref:NAD(P)-dependent oxidoreductase n=1 Tax=Aquibium sp. ELW1220 TaxID=2976766 RepID=UPI0025AF4170|nr:NAD(P)-dependent oxidoreductase [Aquibium sp. ELW1220]MDN2580690.1 NAD(P)-dependent oxidoreductase [Aquibium sp. ELW1220]